jgi:protein TonB
MAPAKPSEPKQPKPPPPKHTQSSAPKGSPSPRNLRNKATPVFAPKLPPLIVPPPIVTATQPALGNAPQSGASDLPGPGQGAGGFGNGLGGGGEGGDGEGDGIATGPRQTKGRLSFKDLPDGLLAPGEERRVGVRYFVNVDGSVSGCRVDEPSGLPQLDVLACRLIEHRFRYRPARDRAGHPVRSTIVEAHTWFSKEDRDGG